MVHMNMQHHGDEAQVIKNIPHQHAFILVGKQQVFGVHMTQYHCELHKYQVILKITLPEDARREYLRQREMAPDDTFVLCNDKDCEFSIPSLGSARTTRFKGSIFQGFRPPKQPIPPNWFPWNLDDTMPVIGPMEVEIERLLLYRPFSHQEIAPPFPTYLLFGQGDEAHMTNLQTAELHSGRFEPPLFGWDYDHVMSLQGPVDWLDGELLEAGIAVSVPAIPRYDDETGETTVQTEPPFKPGDPVTVLYRGMNPPRKVTAGQSFLWATAVCNSEELVEGSPLECLNISPMPKKYWR